MKLVILAGGQQSTISNEKEGVPKPMVDIGGKPVLWHIMKYFSAHGVKEFIICGGYKVGMLKEYFMNYYIYQSDITVDLQENTIEIHKKRTEDWQVQWWILVFMHPLRSVSREFRNISEKRISW